MAENLQTLKHGEPNWDEKINDNFKEIVNELANKSDGVAAHYLKPGNGLTLGKGTTDGRVVIFDFKDTQLIMAHATYDDSVDHNAWTASLIIPTNLIYPHREGYDWDWTPSISGRSEDSSRTNTRLVFDADRGVFNAYVYANDSSGKVQQYTTADRIFVI